MLMLTRRPTPMNLSWSILVCGWISLALVSIAFSLFSGTPWLLEGLGSGYRFALFGHGLITSAVALSALSLPFILLASLLRYTNVLRPIAIASQSCMTALCVVFAVSSYGAYLYTGVYINRAAVVMVTHDTRQLLLHALGFDPVLLAALTLILFAVALALLILVRWTLRDPTRLWRLGVGSLLVLLVAAATSLTADFQAKRSTAIVEASDLTKVRLMAHYQDMERTEAGPFSALLSLLPAQQERPLSSDPVLARGYSSPRQIDMAEYIQSVEQSNLTRHNVLLILIESLRPDVLQSYGSDRAILPTLDTLAARSERFEHCYAHSSHSNYSDTVPYSSQYPLREWDSHYYQKDRSYPRVVMHELLAPFGYRTAIISSQDERWGGMADFFDVEGLSYYFHAGNAPTTREVDSTLSRYTRFMLRAKQHGKVDDRQTVDALIEWIDQTTDEPFAAYVNLQSSHHPFWTPHSFEKPFTGTSPDDEALVHIHASYLAYLNSLAYIDTQLSRLLSHLDTSGHLENTIVIVSADTAIRFATQVAEGKRSNWEIGNATHVYEDVVRVPLIAHIPGREPQTRTETCRHIDVLPTIADAIGLPPHPGFQGKSMLAEDFPQDSPVYLVAQTPLAREYGVIHGGNLLVFDDRAKVFRSGELSSAGQRRLLDEAEKDQLWKLLGTWVVEQLNYYENPLRHVTHYPPVPPE